MAHRTLLGLASQAEDVAAGLRAFRDRLPRDATRITAIVGELYALSSVLREIDNAEGDVQFATSFYDVHDDLKLLFLSLQRTFRAILDMFAQTRNQSYDVVWNGLGSQMEHDEGLGLQDRLQMYRNFLRAQADILQRQRPQRVQELRDDLIILWDAQKVSALRAERRPIDQSGMTGSILTRRVLTLSESIH